MAPVSAEETRNLLRTARETRMIAKMLPDAKAKEILESHAKLLEAEAAALEADVEN
jgi:hypothetical protein